MKKIAIVSLKNLSPDVGVGGVQAVASWLAEALTPFYDVTIFHPAETLDLKELDRFYGTHLFGRHLNLRRLPDYSLLSKFYLLRRSLRLRAVKKMIQEGSYDVIISADKEMDLGRPLIQYLHQPSLDEFYTHPPKNWRRKFYRFLCFIFHRQTLSGLRRNMTITNSQFCAQALRVNYELNAEVIYPPIAANDKQITVWSEKKNDFVIMSRISPEKNIENLIQIMEKVRPLHPDSHLHIIGPARNDAYGQKMRELMARQGDWLTYYGPLGKEQAAEIIARCRYSLSGMAGEPFGLSVAEMTALGLIVFVPALGGQAEIVGQDDRLLFNSPDEATAKITEVMEDENIQSVLLDKLKNHSKQFENSIFVERVNLAVQKFLS